MECDVTMLRAGDESVLRNVAPGVFDNPLDLRVVGEFLADSRHHLAVALNEGVVVAFASGVHYFHPDKPTPELFVNEVGVAVSHRRRGLGRAVIGRLLETARQLGCSEAWVLTEPSNHAANRLFTAAGAVARSEHSVMYSFRL